MLETHSAASSTRAGFEYILSNHEGVFLFKWTFRVAPPTSTHLCCYHAPSHPGHPEGGAVAWPRGHPHDRDLSASGRIGKIRGAGGGVTRWASPRSIQGSRRADCLTFRAGIMRSPPSRKCKPHRHSDALALHNRALRIMGVLRRTAIRPVRARDY